MCLSPGAIGVNLPFEEAARLAAAHGFQGIQIDAGYAAQVGPERVREVLESVGLKPGSFGLPLDVRERDDAAYQEALYQLEAKAKAAKEVDAPVAPPGFPLGMIPATTTRHLSFIEIGSA